MGGKNKQNTLLLNLLLEEINISTASTSNFKRLSLSPSQRGPDSELYTFCKQGRNQQE
jgi:hypothetical protein